MLLTIVVGIVPVVSVGSATAAPPAAGDIYVDVVTNSFLTCGIRTDETISCWTYKHNDVNNPIPPATLTPGGTFSKLAIADFGDSGACAIRTSGKLACWGNTSYLAAPTGTFIDVSTNGQDACAVGTDNTVECWGFNPPEPPLGKYVDIEVGDSWACGIGMDQTIECWADFYGHLAGVPAGTFTELVGTSNTLCGLRTNSSVTCWGQDSNSVGEPTSKFTSLSSVAPGCGIVGTDELSCWGRNPRGIDLPTGSFTMVTGNYVRGCALRTGGQLECWGESVYAIAPGRLLDTRPGEPTVDGKYSGVGRVAPGSTLELPVHDRSGVPVSAGAVMLNVTAVFPSAPGFLTVYPCGSPRPGTSNVNYGIGQVVPNAVFAKVGDGGKVCVFSHSETDILVDVNGWVPFDGTSVSLVPGRLLDTRPGEPTVDGKYSGVGRVTPGSTLELPVHDRSGVPVSAGAVMLNVTAVFPSAPGYLTVFPCGSPRPGTSNVSYGTGQVVPNAVFAKVGDGGKVCVFSHSETDILVDVNGWVPAGVPDPFAGRPIGGTPTPVVPARLFDTRPGEPVADGYGHPLVQNGMPIGVSAAPGQIEQIALRGRNVPETLRDPLDPLSGHPINGAVLNITVVNPDAPGFITAYPCGTPRPVTSNLNYSAGAVVANQVVVSGGNNECVEIYSLARTDLIVDITGFISH